MKKILLILTVLLLVLCTACRDKEVFESENENDVTSTVTESQQGSVTENSTVQGGTNSATDTQSGTSSTIVDEIVLNEPQTGSTITAVDLETGEEVQVTISSKPSSTTQGSSSTVVGSSSTVVNTSSNPTVSSSAPQGSGDNNQGDEETQPPEQSSSSQKPVDKDTMDGYLPYR